MDRKCACALPRIAKRAALLGGATCTMTPQPAQADKNQGWYVGAGVGEYNASLDVVDSEYRNTVFQFFGGSHGRPLCGRQFEPSEDRSWPVPAGVRETSKRAEFSRAIKHLPRDRRLLPRKLPIPIVRWGGIAWHLLSSHEPVCLTGAAFTNFSQWTREAALHSRSPAPRLTTFSAIIAA